MSSNQDLNRIIALFGMFLILAVAVVSDLIIYLRLEQARLSITPFYYNNESVWIRSFAILITGAGFILLAYFIYSRMSKDVLVGLIFLILGLLLAFYPEVSSSGRATLGILVYLARYHGPQSILYHSSGMVFAEGVLAILNRRPMEAAKNAQRVGH